MEGEEYNVESPAVNGFTADPTVIHGTMGSTDVVETVRYKLKGGIPTVFGGITEMQQMTKEICDAAKVGEHSMYDPETGQSTIKDARDGEAYMIAKLADGKCWMTQNLRLKLNASTLPLRGTSTDGKTSDLPENAEWDPGSSWYTVNGISSNTSDTGTLSWNNGNGHGTYYQFNAATAGQGNSVTNNGGNTNQSVCPSGWKLPSSNGGDFTALYNAYNTPAKLTSAPANFTYSGYVDSGSLRSVGSEGRYWSSTSYNSSIAYVLYFGSSGIAPSGNASRRLGLPVRCVAR